MKNIEEQAALIYPELSKLEEHVASGLILKRKHLEFNIWKLIKPAPETFRRDFDNQEEK